MNIQKPIGRAFKRRVHELLKSADFDLALEELCQIPARRVINPLLSFLYSNDEHVRWRAVTAFGAVVAKLADEDMEAARIVMRRLMWNLNDESGGIGWGSPEAMGEIMARHEGLAKEYARILLSYARQDGNYLELEPLQRGLLWGIGRLSQVRPALVKDAVPYLIPYLKSGDATVRGLAAWIMGLLGMEAVRPGLERLYVLYNSRKWVHPDPLEFLYRYADFKDREVAGLIASSLAYGRVAQILKSVSGVLDKMGPSPCGFLLSATPSYLLRIYSGFKHRFTTGEELALMLIGAKSVIKRFGSLYNCFLSGFNDDDETVLTGLSFLVSELRTDLNGRSNSLLPLPEKGSACKRWNLFLRWMVRKDHVDPGGWDRVSPAKLIIPLDTHMHRICLLLKLTGRKNADMRTAMEITRVFRIIEPEDPVRYDFALTRLGIRTDADLDTFLNEKGITVSQRDDSVPACIYEF